MLSITVILALTCSVVSGVPPIRFGARFQSGGRIIGGQDANIADYPYQLCLQYEDFGAFCGATLISPNYALTAAHCTDQIEPQYLSIRAGSSHSSEGGQVVQVEAIYQHENFSYVTAENDISVLKLAENVTVGNSSVIGLAKQTPEADEISTVTGWGVTSEIDTDASDVLQVVQVPIVSVENCREAYSDLGIADTMLCAGFLEEGGKDACTGDSGGPLVVDDVLAGIVSWGTGCAEPGKPGVYTNVASYIEWIQDNVPGF